MTLGALVLSMLLVAGCASRDRTSEATDLAERYLAAVAGGSDDRGWSLLHPDARREMFGDSAERYVASASASDWTNFHFSVESVVADDPGLYLVRLRIDPPRFLVQPGDGNLKILSDASNGQATMAIKFDPLATGVWFAGG